jgi:uncharacterized cupin superfamily protein
MTPASIFSEQFFAHAITVGIQHEDVAAQQIISGAPQTGLVELGVWNGFDAGVWEMTPGAMSDIEVDELCIILSGAGVVQRVIDGRTMNQELAPGVVLGLREGEETVWTVTSTVRKVYLVPTESVVGETL